MTNRNFRIRTKKIGRGYQIKLAGTEDLASFQISSPKNKNKSMPRHVIMEFQITGEEKLPERREGMAATSQWGEEATISGQLPPTKLKATAER